MARVEETDEVIVASSENEEKKESPVEVNEEEGEEEEEEDSNDEPEYEIEAIVDAQRGYFTKGKFGYLVSWKGYGPEHNSWVRHEDAENAKELIAEFWKQESKKKAAAKKPDARHKESPSVSATASKRGRSSPGKDKSPSASVSTKRARGKNNSKAAKSVSEEGDAPEEEEEDSDGEEKKRGKKKARQSENGRPKRKSLAAIEKDADGSIMVEDSKSPMEDKRYNDMKKYLNQKSWENLVSVIDTVERLDDKTLVVYFSLTTGERIREQSELCKKKFPQKLLDFYEKNLRWRFADEPKEMEVEMEV